MGYFELEPFGREPDGHEGFPNSYRVYDTFRGRVFVGTIVYMTELKVFRSASVYDSAEDLETAFSVSVKSNEEWKGDVSYKDTTPIREARKLYKLYMAKLNFRERLARAFGYWWPTFVSIWAIIEIIASIIAITLK